MVSCKDLYVLNLVINGIPSILTNAAYELKDNLEF